MANSPSVGYVPYFTKNGTTAASGWWIKAYVPGTTTPIPIYQDASTDNPMARAEINKLGLPVTSGGVIFAPHFGRKHDLWLFPTAAEADANDTTNAIKVVSDGIVLADGQISSYESVESFVKSVPPSDSVNIISYYGGWEGTVEGPKGGFTAHKTGYTADSPSVGTPVAPSTIGSGAQAGLFWTADGAEWRYIPGDVVQALQFGVRANGITNDHEALSNADVFARESGLPLLLPPGTIVHEGVSFWGTGRVVVGAGKAATVLYCATGSAPVVSWGDPSIESASHGVDGFCQRGRLAGMTLRGNPNSTAGLVVRGPEDDNPNWEAASRGNRFEDIRVISVGSGPGLRNSAWKNQYDNFEIWDCYQGVEIGNESHSCLFNSLYVQGCTAEALIIPEGISQGTSQGITFDTPVFQNSGGTDAMITVLGGSNIQFYNIYSEGIVGSAPNIMLIGGHADGVSVHGMTWAQIPTVSTRKDITVLRLNGGGRIGFDISNVRSFSDCNEVLRIGPYTGTRCRVHAIRALGVVALNGEVVDESILKLTYGEYNGYQHLASTLLNGRLFLGFSDISPSVSGGGGSPEGAVSAYQGSIFSRTDGTFASSVYVKRSGAGNTGWRAVQLCDGVSTAGRPESPELYQSFFDTTLGKPVWWSGTAWVDATGAVV